MKKCWDISCNNNVRATRKILSYNNIIKISNSSKLLSFSCFQICTLPDFVWITPFTPWSQLHLKRAPHERASCTRYLFCWTSLSTVVSFLLTFGSIFTSKGQVSHPWRYCNRSTFASVSLANSRLAFVRIACISSVDFLRNLIGFLDTVVFLSALCTLSQFRTFAQPGTTLSQTAFLCSKSK